MLSEQAQESVEDALAELRSAGRVRRLVLLPRPYDLATDARGVTFKPPVRLFPVCAQAL